MISQDTKDQIEKESLEFAKEYGETTNLTELLKYGAGYFAAATNYAEKLEEWDKIIESKDCELAQLRKDYEFLEEDNRDMEGRLRVYPPSEAEKEAVEWHRKYLELTQLKEIAEKMVKCIQAIEQNGFVGNGSEVAMNEALTAYAEWCKQNLK